MTNPIVFAHMDACANTARACVRASPRAANCSRAPRHRVRRHIKMESDTIAGEQAAKATRAQRRLRQKRKRDDAPPPAVEKTEPSEPAKKKSKKEKRREQKALLAAQEEERARRVQGAATDAATTDAIDPVAKGLRVFVGHLPQSTTEAQLRAHFEPAGEITEIAMVRRHEPPHRFKGMAFLTFVRKAQATRALALDGSLWSMPEAAAAAAGLVRRIVVSIAQPPAQGGARESAEGNGGSDARQGPATAMSGSSASPAASSSCFVGNLPAEATAKQVRAVFRDVCGPATIRKVRMLPSVGETRRAFIDFVQAAAATAAVGKSGLAALGRTLIVSYSRRSEAPSGDGRRSREARVRRRLKREEQREQAGSASASKPVLAIKSHLLHTAAA